MIEAFRANKRRLAVVLIAAIFVCATIPAGAASNGLGVSPRKDYSIQPGRSVTDTLYISNLSRDQDLQVRLRIIDFGAQNETGAPALRLEADTPPTPWSLKPFLTVPASLTIAASKAVNVPMTISIPADLGAGSYYSAVEYTAINPQTKERVNIAASTVSLVFVNVPGKATESLALRQFGTWVSDAAQTKGEFKSAFVGSAPKEFAFRMQNSGNVAEQPDGTIVIKNFFGRTAKVINKANPKRLLALRGQTRRFQVCMRERIVTLRNPDTGQETKTPVCDNPGLLPGRYTAEITLYYGANGNAMKELHGVATFWYVPWWFILAAVVVALIAVPSYWKTVRAARRRRRYER